MHNETNLRIPHHKRQVDVGTLVAYEPVLTL